MGDLLMCERSGDGVSRLPPVRPLQADTTRNLMVGEGVLLKSTFSQLLPARASGGPPPLDWWQLRPTDRAMAARSARTSLSEEEIN